MFIQTEPTPNPEILKFLLGCMLCLLKFNGNFKNRIENMLKHYIPELKKIKSVNV